jgi:hypothetical protein
MDSLRSRPLRPANRDEAAEVPARRRCEEHRGAGVAAGLRSSGELRVESQESVNQVDIVRDS